MPLRHSHLPFLSHPHQPPSVHPPYFVLSFTIHFTPPAASYRTHKLHQPFRYSLSPLHYSFNHFHIISLSIPPQIKKTLMTLLHNVHCTYRIFTQSIFILKQFTFIISISHIHTFFLALQPLHPHWVIPFPRLLHHVWSSHYACCHITIYFTS